MFSGNQQGRFSLPSLRRRVSLTKLPQLQPVFLLQTMVAFSQALNGSAAHAEAVARGLMLDGQRRLNGLCDAAPHLSLSLEQALRMARSTDANDDGLSAEESAAQALFEVCLGLVLQWLSRAGQQPRPSVSAALSPCWSSYNIPVPHTSLPLIPRPQARSCPTLQS